MKPKNIQIAPVQLKNIFKKSKLSKYDFSESPLLIKLKPDSQQFLTKDSLWQRRQQQFIKWTRDKNIFNQQYIKQGKAVYDKFFKSHGFLKGNILDIGGGWGLFRQWWKPNLKTSFIVHDPGIERFRAGPHQFHQTLYQRGLSLPMTFVEGLGENLPYKDSFFDQILIAAVLDHCLQPDQVLNEAFRCLKPKGKILVIQGCQSASAASPKQSFFKKLARHRFKDYFQIGFNLLFKTDAHLHHFTQENLETILKKTGFIQMKIWLISKKANLYGFQYNKSEARSTKSETNPNDQNYKFKTV